jgi:hypothetical protein
MRLTTIVLIAFLALFICLLSASIYGYNRLTDETLIAELRFTPVGGQRYFAHLRTGDFCEERMLPIYGDQWRVDAEFLKWKYWATLFGLDSQYRLDRLEGRYLSVVDQNGMPTLSHDLREDTTVDVVAVAEALGNFNFLVDATYGTSTYDGIDVRRLFSVYRTPTGIITRSVPLPPGQQTPTGLAVEVRRGCGGEPGYWQRFVTAADAGVVRLLRGE